MSGLPIITLVHGLHTYNIRPAWCNRAGRVDRCACDNLDARPIWRLIESWQNDHGSTLITKPQLPGVRTFRGLRGHDRVHRCRTTRRKLGLYLPGDWTQRVTCRRVRVNDRLTHHYLVCPCCERSVKLLFMPRCTLSERIDADVGLKYLLADKLSPEAVVLFARRYAPLLPPRRFVCRVCLGVRYGDVKNPAQFGKGNLAHERHPTDETSFRAVRTELAHTGARQLESLLTTQPRDPRIRRLFGM